MAQGKGIWIIHVIQEQIFLQEFGLSCCYNTALQLLATGLRGLWVSWKMLWNRIQALETLHIDADRTEHVDGTVAINPLLR